MSSLFSFYRFVGYPAFLLLLISSFKPLWSAKIVGIISIFLSLLRFDLCPIISTWENVPCIIRRLYFGTIGWNVLYMCTQPKLRFNSNAFLVIFCLYDLSIPDSGGQKHPTIVFFHFVLAILHSLWFLFTPPRD